MSTSSAADMENKLASQENKPPELLTDQQEEKIEQAKESLHPSCKQKDSPSMHNRNYRKRSVSDSPEKSPENSPSSRKQSRNSDYRDERRHCRRSRSQSRSRSKSRSPRRRRRSFSPQNLIHMMDLGPEVNGHLTTLLWKVEKILENQERVLKNQERLLMLMEQKQQQQESGQELSGDKRLVNGARVTLDHAHASKGELSLPSSLLESVAHVTNETVGDVVMPAGVQSSPNLKGTKATKKLTASTKTTEPLDSTPNPSVSLEESEACQNVVPAGPNDSVVIVTPLITALNTGCVKFEGISETTDVQDNNSSNNDRTKDLLAWAERIQKTSCSIGNFSVNLVKVFFTKDEMLNKNCSGTRGKGALDSAKLDLVKFCAFQLYAVPETEQDVVWKQKCVVSIDEYLRRGNRTRVQNKPKDAARVVVSLNLSGDLKDVQEVKSTTEEQC